MDWQRTMTSPSGHQDSEHPALTERLAGIAAFLPLFEKEGFSFGEWRSGRDQLPWFELSEDAYRFVGTASRLGWVTPSVNWVEWAQTAEAHRLVEDPEAIENATAEDLQRLLTAHIRQNRFVEGHLASVFESGHLTSIIRRADALLREASG